jgi:hypothetical protein
MFSFMRRVMLLFIFQYRETFFQNALRVYVFIHARRDFALAACDSAFYSRD